MKGSGRRPAYSPRLWWVKLRRMLLAVLLRHRRWRDPCTWEMAVCAVFKDEARHLGEWLEFHRLCGVEHFFLYDDESSDDFMSVLAPWIDEGAVTLRKAKGRRQLAIYNHCLRHGARRARWIAFIDLDEFLFSPLGEKLPQVMERYRSYPAVFVHWILFGSSGHVRQPEGGTLENYTRSMGVQGSIDDDFDHRSELDRSEYVTGWSRDGKSIVNPRVVVEAGIHRPRAVAWGMTINECFREPRGKTPPGTPFTCDILRINHYWSRSIEELTAKIQRGSVSQVDRSKTNLARSIERESMLNQIEDRVILRARDVLESTDRSSK